MLHQLFTARYMQNTLRSETSTPGRVVNGH